MGCDMPRLSASLLARMRAAAAAAMRVPIVHADGQPFHALYHTDLALAAQALLERGDYRFMQLLREQCDAVLVEPERDEEHAAFTNLNTPEAFASFTNAKY